MRIKSGYKWGQVFLGFIFSFIALLLLVIGIGRVWVWFNANAAGRSYYYQTTRQDAGNGVKYSELEKATQRPFALTDDWLFKGKPGQALPPMPILPIPGAVNANQCCQDCCAYKVNVVGHQKGCGCIPGSCKAYLDLPSLYTLYTGKSGPPATWTPPGVVILDDPSGVWFGNKQMTYDPNDIIPPVPPVIPNADKRVKGIWYDGYPDPSCTTVDSNGNVKPADCPCRQRCQCRVAVQTQIDAMNTQTIMQRGTVYTLEKQAQGINDKAGACADPWDICWYYTGFGKTSDELYAAGSQIKREAENLNNDTERIDGGGDYYLYRLDTNGNLADKIAASCFNSTPNCGPDTSWGSTSAHLDQYYFNNIDITSTTASSLTTRPVLVDPTTNLATTNGLGYIGELQACCEKTCSEADDPTNYYAYAGGPGVPVGTLQACSDDAANAESAQTAYNDWVSSGGKQAYDTWVAQGSNGAPPSNLVPAVSVYQRQIIACDNLKQTNNESADALQAAINQCRAAALSDCQLKAKNACNQGAINDCLAVARKNIGDNCTRYVASTRDQISSDASQDPAGPIETAITNLGNQQTWTQHAATDCTRVAEEYCVWENLTPGQMKQVGLNLSPFLLQNTCYDYSGNVVACGSLVTACQDNTNNYVPCSSPNALNGTQVQIPPSEVPASVLTSTTTKSGFQGIYGNITNYPGYNQESTNQILGNAMALIYANGGVPGTGTGGGQGPIITMPQCDVNPMGNDENGNPCPCVVNPNQRICPGYCGMNPNTIGSGCPDDPCVKDPTIQGCPSQVIIYQQTPATGTWQAFSQCMMRLANGCCDGFNMGGSAATDTTSTDGGTYVATFSGDTVTGVNKDKSGNTLDPTNAAGQGFNRDCYSFKTITENNYNPNDPNDYLPNYNPNAPDTTAKYNPNYTGTNGPVILGPLVSTTATQAQGDSPDPTNVPYDPLLRYVYDANYNSFLDPNALQYYGPSGPFGGGFDPVNDPGTFSYSNFKGSFSLANYGNINGTTINGGQPFAGCASNDPGTVEACLSSSNYQPDPRESLIDMQSDNERILTLGEQSILSLSAATTMDDCCKQAVQQYCSECQHTTGTDWDNCQSSIPMKKMACVNKKINDAYALIYGVIDIAKAPPVGNPDADLKACSAY